MSSVNLYAKEISLKIVYYGPGLGGKTSSLQFIHRAIKPDSRGQLVSLSTGVDRTLYFDFLPVKLPKLRGYTIRVQLYTVPGQVHYNSTRKLVLTGADGVVFVGDSQAARREANVESLTNLQENLREQGMALDRLPHLFQYNKRDVSDAMPVPDMDGLLNQFKAPFFETTATSGRGVFEALKSITTLVLSDLRRRGVWRADAPPPQDPTGAGEWKDEGSSPGLPSRTEGSISASLQALADRDALQNSEQSLRPLKPEEPAPVEPSETARTAAFSELLAPGPMRDAASAVEYLIQRGDFAEAVARVAKVFNEAATGSAAVAASSGHEGPTLYALMLGIPGERFIRFRQTVARAASGGAASADALFALFFLVDAALRHPGPAGTTLKG